MNRHAYQLKMLQSSLQTASPKNTNDVALIFGDANTVINTPMPLSSVHLQLSRSEAVSDAETHRRGEI